MVNANENQKKAADDDRKQLAYVLIAGDSAELMAGAVSVAVESGYEPVGGPFVHDGRLTQAVWLPPQGPDHDGPVPAGSCDRSAGWDGMTAAGEAGAAEATDPRSWMEYVRKTLAALICRGLVPPEAASGMIKMVLSDVIGATRPGFPGGFPGGAGPAGECQCDACRLDRRADEMKRQATDMRRRQAGG